MSLFINTNHSALNAHRQLNSISTDLSTSFERLSSGLRINGAKDDSAGLSITTRLTAQVKGLNQAVRNSNTGISLAQTAEGALRETTSILQRIRELAVQSANSTNNDSDRASLQAEVAQLKEEIDRIAGTTDFNGNKLFDGHFLFQNLQVGANVDETVSISIGGASTTNLARQARYTSSGNNFAVGGLTITNSKGEATDIRDAVFEDDELSTVSPHHSAISKVKVINDSFESTGVRAILGKTEVVLGDPIASFTLDESNVITLNDVKILGFTYEDNDASGSLVDAINAESDATGVVARVDSEGKLALTADDGRNIIIETSNAVAVNLGFAGATGTGIAVAGGPLLKGFGEFTLQSDDQFELSGAFLDGYGFTPGVYGVNDEFSVNSADISTKDGAEVAIDIMDLALNDVSASRAVLGALQNRLESTINNLNTASENLSASRSRILDADFASETAQLSRNQIIQQASTSILAQANQQPQIALALIR
jgi:flagellin